MTGKFHEGTDELERVEKYVQDMDKAHHTIDQWAAEKYWKKNITLMIQLLVVWFIVSYGCGVLLADFLDQFRFFGFPVGFWFAQQGSIYVFVILIYIYATRMHHIEKNLHIDDDAEDEAERS